MHKLKYIVFAAILVCLVCAQIASAQTPANVNVISGNGQIFCSCPGASGLVSGYYPLVVQVTDANNKPIANTTVTWSNYGFGSMAAATTTTGSDGTTSNTYVPYGFGVSNANTQPSTFQVSAFAGSGSATFTLTEAYTYYLGGYGQIEEDETYLPAATDPSDAVTATSGQQTFTFNGTSGQSFRLGVLTSGGTFVPGVSVRIANFQTSPSAMCVTGAGADPGSVLTDATGYATCTPVFSGTGTGAFELVIGGVRDTTKANILVGDLLTYYLNAPPALYVTVTAAVPSSVSIVSGNGQSGTSGTTLAYPLVAQVNGQNSTTLAGQSVVWTVSPAGAATATSTTTTSDANGQVSNEITLSSAASGTVTVTAALASNSAYKATFTETAIPLITTGGLVKVSGDGQTALASATFASPLVVQVNTSTGAAASGIAVTFSATNGAILSATSVSTNSSGQASVTVTAPASAGTVVVTASVSGFSQTFTLTVNPPGPIFTGSSFVNAADLKVGSLSPCSLAKIIASGIAPAVTGIVEGNSYGIGPLPTTLATDTVTVGGTAAPILNVATISNVQQLTFQVPCGAATGTNAVTVTVNGGSASTSVSLLPASPGVFQTSTVLSLTNGGSYPLGVFVRPDGTFVTASNQARKGEVIVAYATGLGPVSPSVNSNALPLPSATSSVTDSIVVGVNNGGVQLIAAQLVQDLVGVYKVSFQIPSNATSGTVVFSLGVASGTQTYYSAGSALPIL